MKKILVFVLAACLHVVGFAQIRPDTKYCMKGSDAHPEQYCADKTPCKVVKGPNKSHTVCLPGTPNPPPGAETHTSSCWSRVTEYTCLEFYTDCARLDGDPSCTERGTKECTRDGESKLMAAIHPKLGACQAYTRRFSCLDGRKPDDSSYVAQTGCTTTGSMNGLDWSTTKESSSDDFIKAATGQEFARQVATYGTKNGGSVDNLFPGVRMGCKEGFLGLKSCCKSDGGGVRSNNSILKSAGMSVAAGAFKQGAGYAIQKGSHYVYDFMMNTAEYMTPALESALQSGMGNTIGGAGGFGAMGFGTTAEAAGGTFFGGTSSMAVGNTGIYFNPYALAAAVAIQIVMDAISCTQEERDLARFRVENLCYDVGTYCSQKIMVLGVQVGCNQTTHTFCCYNGLMGIAIAKGGKEQLNMGWGTPASPNCGGFSAADITRIDMNAPSMQNALAPFKQQIMKTYEGNIAGNLKDGSIAVDAGVSANDRAKKLCLQRKIFDPSTVCN